MLGRTVGADVGVALQRGRTGNVDDPSPAAAAHVADHLGTAVVNGMQVDVDDLLPLRGGHLVEGIGGGRAGAVHQDVDGAQGVGRGAEGAADLLRVGDIAGGAVVPFGVARHGRLQGLQAAAQQADAVTLVQQAAGDGGTDAAARPGYQRMLHSGAAISCARCRLVCSWRKPRKYWCGSATPIPR